MLHQRKLLLCYDLRDWTLYGHICVYLQGSDSQGVGMDWTRRVVAGIEEQAGLVYQAAPQLCLAGASCSVAHAVCGAQVPKTVPLKWREKATMAEMLQHFHTLADTLYYEILDLPLPQLEQLKTLRARGPRALPAEGFCQMLPMWYVP